MSAYSVYVPGFGWAGNAAAACSHDAARAFYARLPRAAFPSHVRVLGPGGFMTVAWHEVVVPTLDELEALAHRAHGKGARVEAHGDHPTLCRLIYPEGHRRHEPGPGETWVRRLLARDLIDEAGRRRAREASEARRARRGVVAIPVRVTVEAVRR